MPITPKARARRYFNLFFVLFTCHNAIVGQLPPDRGEDCGEEYNQCYINCVALCATHETLSFAELAIDYNLFLLSCESDNYNHPFSGHEAVFGYPVGEEPCWMQGNRTRRNIAISISNTYYKCVEQFCGELCYYRDIYIYSCPD